VRGWGYIRGKERQQQSARGPRHYYCPALPLTLYSTRLTWKGFSPKVPLCYNMLQILQSTRIPFGFTLRTDAIGVPMSAIARYLLKLLVGAVVGALLGVLVGGIIAGYSWETSALIGGCIFAALSTLYGPATIHSDPTSRGATYTPHH